MALILEVLDGDGVRARRRLDSLPLTIGRALTNDLVLDDPYADGTHARIGIGDDGAPTLEDLGSLNGIRAARRDASGERRQRISLGPGVEVRVGRTTLRFRDDNEPVPPALPDKLPLKGASAEVRGGRSPDSPTLTAPTPDLLPGVLATTAGRLLLVTVVGAAIALYAWLDSHDRSSASTVFGVTLAFLVVAAMWAGIWSVASRVVVQRFHFVGHLALVSAVTAVVLAWVVANEWLTFFFPDSGLLAIPELVFGFAVTASLVAGHLALASNMNRRRQWRAGLIVAAATYTVFGLGALTEDDSFTSVASFSGVVKPLGERWIPTKSVEEFGAVMLKLKGEVDAMVAEE